MLTGKQHSTLLSHFAQLYNFNEELLVLNEFKYKNVAITEVLCNGTDNKQRIIS